MSTQFAPAPGFIEVSDLRVEYRPGVPALDGLEMSVASGEFVAVLGPSGCGKSTLLQCLSGLLAPARGAARVGGDRSAIGYVFQDHRLLPWRTVTQNLDIVLAAAGVAPAERAARIERYLRMLGIEEHGEAWPLKLSGGQRQRASIARALAIHPSVVFMDEPFSTLDEVTARSMREQLGQLWAEHRFTTVFVTHSIREAVFLANRIFILSRGPGHVLDVVDVPVPAPREYDDPALRELESEIVANVMSAWGVR